MTAKSRDKSMTARPPMNQIFPIFFIDSINKGDEKIVLKLLIPLKLQVETVSVTPSTLKKLMTIVLIVGYRNTRAYVSTAGVRKTTIINLFFFILTTPNSYN
jgi:hypothetical protein